MENDSPGIKTGQADRPERPETLRPRAREVVCLFRSVILWQKMHRDEIFIEAVREYPFLYDASDPAYHDNRKRTMHGNKFLNNLKNGQLIYWIVY